MAEKRKLPPRAGREPAAKRRVSEAAPKKKAPTPRVPSPPPEPVEAPLPSKLKDGEPLPIRRVRQPDSLSETEYQSIAESAVLLASLERSKKKWLSDGILVRYYTKPKKTKREQIERNNPPKDSMVKVGLCDVTVGPHYFDAMLYTVKDPNAQPQPLQYAPPRPMMHYNGPNNFQRYPPYPSPNQQRPPYSPAPAGRPPQGYQTPQQRAPNASSPAGQRPPQANQTGQPAKPSPDPVIQMLATRAAADPELKALMRVVASSQASQEQLRAFQAHIDELNAIIKAREQQQNAAGTSTQRPASQPGTPAPQGKSTPDKSTPSQPESQQKQESGVKTSQGSGSKSQPAAPTETPKDPEKPASPEPKDTPAKSLSGEVSSGSQSQTSAQTQPLAPSQDAAAPIKQEPDTNITQAPPTAGQPAASTSLGTPAPAGSPAPNAAHPAQTPGNFQQPPRPGQAYTPQPPIQSRPPQYGSPTPYYRPPGPQQPQARAGYKSVVFEFTSPLTPYGNVNSGHAGSGDRYLFPEHSILEWIPSENVILASFLIVRKVDPSKPFPIEPEGEPTTSRGKSKASKSKKGKGKDATEASTPNPANPTDTPQKSEPTDKTGINPNLSVPATPGTPAEPVVKDETLKEYWQPVTFRIHASNPRVLEPLTRVVKPAEEVRKYMNEIMDRAERAPDGFPAFRLPREDARDAFESEGTPASGINVTRSRPSRAAIKAPGEESEAENLLDVEEEEDLLDFYGAPMGLPPLKALKA
ncbi:hypothetical protein N7476_007349 [Penicillium atrosanguineum]|uniref:SWR1-complex protein 3 domain-containing protein n=1 Tax=Penicillium atrosanguineum TaxID=1132637 RepID=A0A9W9PVZ5_9EURO|nr:hypothetical protein N7526_006895 [Penicillium atrosanguineum]KAJ5311489.1 hypothetical protein N7476_007349 [Penicillium atrosanguineum]